MKIYLDTIGCRLNQSEIERIGARFSQAGHEIVATAEEADMVVVNTCAVTGQAASDSRSAIRRAAHTGDKKIVVTGCWSSLEPDAARSLPGVYQVIPNSQKDHLVEEIIGSQGFEEYPMFPVRKMLPNHRRTRAFVKVQDGCNNHCTFCITRIARGVSRSRPAQEIINEIRLAAETGTREVVLSGVNMGAWGRDLDARGHFRDLIENILLQTPIPRIRLSSLEPWDLDGQFFDLWQDDRLCRHLHLPLQSGSARILRLMARKTTPDKYLTLVGQVRSISPDIAITTDLMVGFPGEGEEDFRESLEFVRAVNFAAGHVFKFSARPGTPAANMQGQVPSALRKERSKVMRDLFYQNAASYNERFIGQTLPVLWEGDGDKDEYGRNLEGHSDNYIRIRAASDGPRWNRIDMVLIDKSEGKYLSGTIQT